MRPQLSCQFALNDDKMSGRVMCDVTDVLVDISDLHWEFDGDMRVASNTGPSGPYEAKHQVSPSYLTGLTHRMIG